MTVITICIIKNFKLLRSYYVPVTLLGNDYIVMNETDKVTASMEHAYWKEKLDNKQVSM